MCREIKGSKQHESHYVYTTRNKVNKKLYIGKHSCQYDKCDYVGSGTSLKRAIEKYGKDKFEVISRVYCRSAAEAYRLEADTVTQEIADNPMYYNIIIGGDGVRFSENRLRPLVSDEAKANMSKAQLTRVSKVKERFQCEHCKEFFAKATITRFHNDHCWRKPKRLRNKVSIPKSLITQQWGSKLKLPK